MLTLDACAKVNLTLEVLRKRPDGYHDIASVVQTVGLYDTLTLETAPFLIVEGSPPDVRMEDDLVYRAARLLQDEAGVSKGAAIRLEKRIPVAAGLGGGSSDAAATLLGLDRLWGLGLGVDGLHPLAARLGSDVPFFLYGGTALIEGRGERVTPLPAPQGDLGVVLLRSPFTIPNKTASLYRALPSWAYSDGEATRELVGRLRAGQPLDGEALLNAFEAVGLDVFRDYMEDWFAFERAGAPDIHLTGAGPTLFTIAPWEQAEGISLRLFLRGYESYLVKMVGPCASPSGGG